MSGFLTDCEPRRAARRSSQLANFRARCASLTNADLEAAEALHRWSAENYRDFWREFLDWADLSWTGSAAVVSTSDDVEHAVFFPEVRLNYAENLVRPIPGGSDGATALTSLHADGSVEHVSRGALRRRVQATAMTLTAHGLGDQDRVVVLAPSNGRTVVAALAAAALGAAVSTAMPDMGPTALLGRLQQVEPTVLVVDRTNAGGWSGAAGDTLSTVLTGLPTVGRLLVLDDQPLPELDGVPVSRLGTTDEHAGPPPAAWPRLPFNHPLFVVFSSGTSGPPKAMVHGAGGTLLEHLKEHRLHVDLSPADTLFHHSTTGWMVWNRALSALAVGARLVVSERPPTGPESLWQVVAEQRVTVFGTSPAYLQLCQDAGYRPADEVDLTCLREVLSSGAVLHESQYDWFADAVGPVPLQSISGGTDILGAFVLGHPELPVRRGRISTRGLGMDVVAVDRDGTEVVGQVGELVCRNPFPSRPIRFLRDPDGRRYHAAYFAQQPGVWTHGDLIDVAADGSVRLHGRSDGVLNIDGVRIGPAEIYAVLRGIDEIADAMAVERRDPDLGGRSRLVLLVVLRRGTDLDADLATRIRRTLRRQASAAHVPSVIVPVAELPVTHNGKPSERAAQDALGGGPVANIDALRNPASLTAITEAFDRATRSPDVPGTPGNAAEGAEAGAVVSRLWHLTLGPGADATRSFGDLGGTSRQAMTLVRQLRVLLGRDISLEAFMADPTLTGLSAAVRRAARSADAPAVVRLAAGDPQLPPLFFLHDAWGDVDVYWPVAQLLTRTGPVYGVRNDLHREDGARRSVAELATAAAREIDRTAPTGPVRLAGHSFGGLVAFEVAGLLGDTGREVEFVGLLDSMPPRTNLGPLERAVTHSALRVASVVPGLRREPLRMFLRGRWRSPQRNDEPGTPDDAAAFTASSRLYHEHRWRPWAGPVTYFQARRRLPAVQHMLHTWRRIAPRLTVVEVPGAHHDLVGQANVEVLAARLSEALPSADVPTGAVT